MDSVFSIHLRHYEHLNFNFCKNGNTGAFVQFVWYKFAENSHLLVIYKTSKSVSNWFVFPFFVCCFKFTMPQCQFQLIYISFNRLIIQVFCLLCHRFYRYFFRFVARTICVKGMGNKKKYIY